MQFGLHARLQSARSHLHSLLTGTPHVQRVLLSSLVLCELSGEPPPHDWPLAGHETETRPGRVRLVVDSVAGDYGTPLVPGEDVGSYCRASSDIVRCRLRNDTARGFGTALRICCAVGFENLGGALVHAAGLMANNGNAVLALAPSGGGKSTLTSLATSLASLSDETVGLTFSPEPMLHGTAFRSSSERPPQLSSTRLRALVLLSKSDQISLVRCSPIEATRSLLAAWYRLPSSPIRWALSRFADLSCEIPCFRLGFPLSREVDSVISRLLE